MTRRHHALLSWMGILAIVGVALIPLADDASGDPTPTPLPTPLPSPSESYSLGPAPTSPPVEQTESPEIGTATQASPTQSSTHHASPQVPRHVTGGR